MSEKLRKLSKGKAMLAAIGMAAAAEAAIPATTAEAQTIQQYTHDERLGQDPRIATLPKGTTLFQAARRGEVNLLNGATLDPKITHVYQTSRGGLNVIVNKDKIRKDVVIIQEGYGGNVIISGTGTNTINGKRIQQHSDGTVTVEDAAPGERPDVKMPDQWPFTNKNNPFNKPGFPFNK